MEASIWTTIINGAVSIVGSIFSNKAKKDQQNAANQQTQQAANAAAYEEAKAYQAQLSGNIQNNYSIWAQFLGLSTTEKRSIENAAIEWLKSKGHPSPSGLKKGAGYLPNPSLITKYGGTLPSSAVPYNPVTNPVGANGSMTNLPLKTASILPSFLTNKMAGLPVYGWLALGGGAVYVYKQRRGSKIRRR